MSFRVGTTRTTEGKTHLTIEQWNDMKCTATVRIYPGELMTFIRMVVKHADNIFHIVGLIPFTEKSE